MTVCGDRVFEEAIKLKQGCPGGPQSGLTGGNSLTGSQMAFFAARISSSYRDISPVGSGSHT